MPAEKQKIYNGHQLITDRTTRSHVLVDTLVSSKEQRYVHESKVAIPDAGNFETEAIYTAATGAGSGRFSDGPGLTDLYANGKELCVYAGNEMPWGGFFMFSPVTVTLTDITFDAAADTITTASQNFNEAGFLPGMRITVSDAAQSGNNRSFTIKSVTSAASSYKIITVIEDAIVAEAAGASVTITASVGYGGVKDVIDYTEAANNSLKTSGNVIDIGGGLDSYTRLLLHCDGDDAGTIFPDAAGVHSPTAVGDAQTVVANKKFGTASAKFDGAGDYITIPDHVDWFMGTGKFTIDFWVKFDGGTFPRIFCQYVDDNNYVDLVFDSTTGNFRFMVVNAGSVEVFFYAAVHPTLGQWYHIALVRGAPSADDIMLYKDGQLVGQNNPVLPWTWPDLAAPFTIGAGHTTYFMGNIDEFRVSKGIARWSGAFAPPSKAYSTSQAHILGFSTRPLSGMNVYLSEANTQTGSTTTGKTWSGNDFSDVSNPVDGTQTGSSPTQVTLAQDGEFSFDSTVDVAVPMHFEGLYLYAYLFNIENVNSSAELYHAAAHAPFQKSVDIWDGVYRQPLQAQVYDATGKSYKDFTLEVYEPSDSAVEIGMQLDALAATEHVLLGFEERQAAFLFTMYADKLNFNAAIPTIEYYSPTGWISVGTIVDQTVASVSSWNSLGQTGLLAWHPPEKNQEAQQTLFGMNAYYYRISFDAALSADVCVDLISGIPAQQEIGAFDFCARYANMALACAPSENKEGNRIDYTMPNAPDVWNGELSSRGGTQSLYFGGAEKLTAAIELFNRFGSNIFSFLLVLKAGETYLLSGNTPDTFKIYPISYNLGCPAHKTLCTAEVGYEVSGQVQRNVALWLSATGPMLFDGSVLVPLPGLEIFFDETQDECVNFDAFENCAGGYDRVHKEYNLLLCTGSATVPNKWVCYDLIKKKWFEKVPPEYPLCLFPVTDEFGGQYLYGGFENGRVRRMGNVPTWDGTAIASLLETGDFHLSDSLFDITRLKKVKIIAERLDEAVNLIIKHQADSSGTNTELGRVMDMDAGTARILRHTQACEFSGWTHRLQLSTATSASNPGLTLLAMALLFTIERMDE